MERETNFVKSTLILIIGIVMPKITSFITLPLYTAYLTKAEYGTYDLILTLSSLFIPIATLMLPHAAFRFLIEYQKDEEEKKRIVTNTFLMLLAMASVSIVVLYMCLFNMSNLTRFLICLYFLLDVATGTCQQISRGLSKNREYSLSAVILALTNMILVVVALCILNTGINGVLWCLIIATFCSGVYLLFHLKIISLFNIKYIKKKYVKALLLYSWPLIPNNISSWAMNMSDKLVVLSFLGVEANAVLAVAHKLPQILMLVQNAFTMSWQESAVLSVRDKDVSEYYSKMFRILYNVMSGATMVLIAGTPVMFTLLIRGNYDEAFYQVPIYFIAFFFSCISTYLGGIYLAYKKSFNVGITTVVSAIINLVVNIVLIRYIGLFAASLSTLCGYVFIDIYRYIDVQKFVRIKFDIKQIIVGLLGIGFSCALCYMRQTAVDAINIIVSLIICCLFNKDIIKKMLKIAKCKLDK